MIVPGLEGGAQSLLEEPVRLRSRVHHDLRVYGLAADGEAQRAGPNGADDVRPGPPEDVQRCRVAGVDDALEVAARPAPDLHRDVAALAHRSAEHTAERQ